LYPTSSGHAQYNCDCARWAASTLSQRRVGQKRRAGALPPKLVTLLKFPYE
jgi:hypothetical protein